MAGDIDPNASLIPQSPAPPPSPTQDSSYTDGPRTGQVVGQFDGGEVVANGRASTDFASFEEAAAYARGTGESTAVVAENGRYAVYQTTEQRNFSIFAPFSGTQFTRDNAITDQGAINGDTQPSDSSVVAMVTDDGYLVDFSTGTAPLSGPESGPFAARIDAFGPDLQSIPNRDQFEQQFELALRDTALYSLDQAQSVANQTLSRLQGDSFTSEDRAAIDRTLPGLQDVDARIGAVEGELSGARTQLMLEMARVSLSPPNLFMTTLGQLPPGVAQAVERVNDLQTQLDALNVERIGAAQSFPLLLRVNSSEFAALSDAQQVRALRGETEGVLEDIETTRQNVIDGDFNLWTNAGLRQTVSAGLGLGEERSGWVEGRASSEATWEAVTSIGTTVVGVGLAIGGTALAPFSAGTSLGATAAGTAMIAGGIGVGLYEAINATQDYLRDQAAVNTSIDPNAGLLPPEQAGHWGWVAAAWVGVGIDVAQAISAASKLARAGSTVDDLLAATPAGQRALGQVADELGVTPQVLREALSGSRDASLSTGVLASDDFTRAFGSDAGEAVTLINRTPEGQLDIQVVFRDGLTPTDRVAALGEEAIHVRQLAGDGRFAAQADLLSEANLARWPELSETQKLEAFQANLQIEVAAQRELIEQAAGSPQAAAAGERLSALRTQLDEVDGALSGGRVPTWLADAPPPRLFAEPIYPRTNAAAQAAGYPAPPAGHYYRNLGNGEYELTRFPSSRNGWVDPADVTPMRVRLNDDGTRTLVPRDGTISPAMRRAEFETRFGEALQSPAGQALEASLDAANVQSPFVRAYARSFNDAFAQLESLAGPGARDAVLSRVAGLSDSQAESVLRGALRSDTAAAISELPASQQMPALLQAADALPSGSNRLRGELFTEFREGAMPPGFRAVEPATNGLRISGNSRIADGIMTVDSAVLPNGDGPARAGRYLVEDKFGSSFNIDQARAYSAAMDDAGRIATRDGSVSEGVVYVFSDPAQAAAAIRQLSRVDGLSESIHVAILRAPGEFQWLR